MNLTENPPIQSLPPYLRVHDIKTYFGLHEQAVWKMLGSREIIGSKRGKLWFVETASIFKWMKKYRSIHKED